MRWGSGNTPHLTNARKSQSLAGGILWLLASLIQPSDGKGAWSPAFVHSQLPVASINLQGRHQAFRAPVRLPGHWRCSLEARGSKAKFASEDHCGRDAEHVVSFRRTILQRAAFSASLFAALVKPDAALAAEATPSKATAKMTKTESGLKFWMWWWEVDQKLRRTQGSPFTTSAGWPGGRASLLRRVGECTVSDGVMT